MEDYVYSLREITHLVQQVADRLDCTVESGEQDPHDSRHLLITARLCLLPADAAPVHLEAVLPGPGTFERNPSRRGHLRETRPQPAKSTECQLRHTREKVKQRVLAYRSTCDREAKALSTPLRGERTF